MRLFIIILILIFNLQSITKADDIRDFQIEGMSIGDSLLEYFSEEEIKAKKKNYYPKSKRYHMIEFEGNFKNYEILAFHLEENDKKYLIQSIKGVIFFKKKIKKCMKKKEEIVTLVSNFLNKPKDLYEEKEYPDKRGKIYVSEFNIDKDLIRIWCVDFYKKTEKTGVKDNLALSIEPYNFGKWLKNEAW